MTSLKPDWETKDESLSFWKVAKCLEGVLDGNSLRNCVSELLSSSDGVHQFVKSWEFIESQSLVNVIEDRACSVCNSRKIWIYLDVEETGVLSSESEWGVSGMLFDVVFNLL